MGGMLYVTMQQLNGAASNVVCHHTTSLTPWSNRGAPGRVTSIEGLPGGARAVPPLANVRVGVTMPTRAQQKWPGSELMDWLKQKSYSHQFMQYSGLQILSFVVLLLGTGLALTSLATNSWSFFQYDLREGEHSEFTLESGRRGLWEQCHRRKDLSQECKYRFEELKDELQRGELENAQGAFDNVTVEESHEKELTAQLQD
uniref:Uncharacterized protein n=1 Tax=Romanomermis culicivorax TaxID=13658 RepID=A0A915JHJ9_ROMCU